MDAKRRKEDRRHCSECRRKYLPKASAKKQQETCGSACRLKRRARLARERYAKAPVAAREAARKRKRKARSKRQEGPAPPSESLLPPEVTRAIAQEMERLSPEGWLKRGYVEQALRRVARRACASPMSRAGLGANLPVVSRR